MLDDSELLRRYAEDGIEAAFGELVARYVSLVYSAALRLTNGRESMAQDVAQTVFTDLARKAGRLAGHRCLTGWLYTSTRFAASKAVRAEHIRQEREQEAYAMNQLLSKDADEVRWSDLRPVLDDAMGELTDADRLAVLLRFFEQRSLAEVGSILGCGEEAARKRVSRALDKLRILLAGRGIKTSATALAVTLAVHGTQAAPGGLATTLTTAALSALTNSATATLIPWVMTLTKTKITVAVAASTLLIGGLAIRLYRSSTGQPEARFHSMVSAPKISDASSEAAFAGGAAKSMAGRPNDAEDAALTAALARVRAALHSSKRTQKFPQTEMEEALTALGTRRKAALPLLKEGLRDSNFEVRLRAASGLGFLGSDAVEAVPNLVEMLRTFHSGADAGFATAALEAIGGWSDFVPDLVEILKSKPDARLSLANLIGTASDPTRKAEFADYVAPLLKDSDLELRSTAAYIMTFLQKGEAGPEIIRAAIEALRSPNDDLKIGGLTTFANMGDKAKEAVPDLIEAAKTAARPDVRMSAARLLDTLDPAWRGTGNSDATLAELQRSRDFSDRVRAGQATVPEMINALADLPSAAPVAAAGLGKLGFNGFGTNREQMIDALNGLRGLMNSKEPEAREAAAQAIKQLQPTLPKPLYSLKEVAPAFEAMTPILQTMDGEQRTRLKAAMDNFSAMQKATWQWPGEPSQMTSGMLSMFGSMLKEANRGAYDAFAAEMKKIDPEVRF